MSPGGGTNFLMSHFCAGQDFELSVGDLRKDQSAGTGFIANIQSLVEWYTANARQLPWRQTRDPYAIWVSETMLQQTRVDTVIPYYHAFLTRFPTVRELAEATEEEVLHLWQGLGYYSRARNLQRAARQVVAQYSGEIPEQAAHLRSLPGIGSYTCGAVRSIAFGHVEPAVDGNVARVMARFLGIREPLNQASVARRIAQAMTEWQNQSEPGKITQALMELGATVCVPRSPGCARCPLVSACTACKLDAVTTIPSAKKRPPPKLVDVYALWLVEEGRIWLQRRPEKGVLAGQWQLPALEVPRKLEQPNVSERTQSTIRPSDAADPNSPLSASAESRLVAVFGDILWPTDEAQSDAIKVRKKPEVWLATSHFVEVMRVNHVFTHLRWQLRVVRPLHIHIRENLAQQAGWLSVPLDSWGELDLATVYRRIVSRLLSGQPLH